MVAVVAVTAAVTVAAAGDAADNTADATNDTANRAADPTNDPTDGTNRAADTSNHAANASNNTGDWRAAAGAACTRRPAVAAMPARTIAVAATAASVADADRTGAARSRVRRSPDSRVFAIRGAASAGHGAGTAREAVCDAADVQPNLAPCGRDPDYAGPCSAGGLALLQ